MGWSDIKCWFLGHELEFKYLFDGEEWPGKTFWDDAVRAQYTCSKCGHSEDHFVCWGVMSEIDKDSLDKLKEYYQ